MLKYLIVCLSLFYPKNTLAQIVTLNGTITDEHKKAIPYAVIVSNPSKYGTSSDSIGQFSLTINSDSVKALIFYCIGFEKKEISLKDLNNSNLVIELQETGIQLNDISILAKKNKQHSGVLGKKRLSRDYKSTDMYGWEEGIFLKPKHDHSYLNEIYVYVVKYQNPNADFRIHIYADDSLPEKEITGRNVIAHGTEGNEWVRVDLSDLYIPINNGVYVGVEWLHGGESGHAIGLTRSYGTDAFCYNRNLDGDEYRYFKGDAPMIYGTYTYVK